MTKQKIINTVNALLRPFGAEIVKSRQACDPSSSYMKDEKLRGILIDALSEIAQVFFTERLSGIGGIVGNSLNYTSEVERFLTLYASRPFKENAGGSGFHNAFWLFLFARTLNPNLIIESGVWKGYTSWLLEQACPKAQLFGFDINLSRLEHTHGSARFYEHDWSKYQFESVDSERSLVFFDCHVNHAKRILEAHDRGFRHIIFDDNPPAHLLYAYGLPGFPTANMVWEGCEVECSEVVWYWQGKEISYVIDTKEIAKARELMKMHEMFPDVGEFTRYGGFSFLTYVNVFTTGRFLTAT